jgi:rhodanese-related sulfurtransferase
VAENPKKTRREERAGAKTRISIPTFAKDTEMTATLSRNDLKAKIDHRENFKLVETLPESAYQTAHLPGAIHLPPDQVRELAPTVLPDKQAPIVVYCGGPT